MSRLGTLVLAAGLALAAGKTLAQTAPLPAALKPLQVVGPGLAVMDLEAQKAWYMSRLGMVVVGTYGPKDKPFEYVMGFEGQPGGAVVALLRSAQRQPGALPWGRVILRVPDAKALAAFMEGQGIKSREAVPGVAYFIADPEGNAIEFYTPPNG
ncbi:MAG: VOC family protein [Phenylobacterium sp.]